MGLKSALCSKLMRVYKKGFSKNEYGIFHANTINGYFYVLTLATKFLLLCFGTQLESPHSVVNNELFESLDDMEIKLRFLAI